MHGVGANMAETLLADVGFTHVSSVKEQREPDGTFPTVNFPNPEEAGAMDMVMALAKKSALSLLVRMIPMRIALRLPRVKPMANIKC